MVKPLKIIAISLFLSSLTGVAAQAQEGYSCFLPKGSFYRGILQSSVSSEFNNEGDLVRVVNPHDIFIGKNLCIPKNSVFLGKVNYVQPAKKGVNGAFAVKFDTLMFPNSHKFVVDASLWSKKNGIIGGDFSPKNGYRTVLHRAEGLDPGAQVLVPYGESTMGSETQKKAGEEVNLILNDDVFIKFFNAK